MREQWWCNLLFCPEWESEFHEIDEPRRAMWVNRTPPLQFDLLNTQEWPWTRGPGNIRFALFDQPADSEFVIWLTGQVGRDRLPVVSGCIVSILPTPELHERSTRSVGWNYEQAKRYGV